MRKTARIALLATLAFVAVTAAVGGIALVLGSLVPSWSSVLVPPHEYLEGSPFDSYVVPGVVLLVVVAGAHAAAFVLGRRRSPALPLASAAAGFICLVWIFVQLVYIPFSFLQAVYFAAGLLEVGLTLMLLGVFPRTRMPVA